MLIYFTVLTILNMCPYHSYIFHRLDISKNYFEQCLKHLMMQCLYPLLTVCFLNFFYVQGKYPLQFEYFFGNCNAKTVILLGCVENHVQCLPSFEWKYRTYRTFHHISSAEACQEECSKYSSRVNYFTHDISLHRCLCTANCLIGRGERAQNDITGTISDHDPSGLCQVKMGKSYYPHVIIKFTVFI